MRATCVRHAFWAVAVKTVGDGGEVRLYGEHLRVYACGCTSVPAFEVLLRHSSAAALVLPVRECEEPGTGGVVCRACWQHC
jgi:hypothetical protein